MQYKVKVTVIDKKLYPELQEPLLRRPPVRGLSLLQCGGYLRI